MDQRRVVRRPPGAVSTRHRSAARRAAIAAVQAARRRPGRCLWQVLVVGGSFQGCKMAVHDSLLLRPPVMRLELKIGPKRHRPIHAFEPGVSDLVVPGIGLWHSLDAPATSVMLMPLPHGGPHLN